MKDNHQLREKLFNLFPFLKNAGAELQTEFLENGNLARLEPEKSICFQEAKCTCVPFVLDGVVRVYKLGQSGREITLYRIQPGQCMIASCILCRMPFPAFAVTETNVEAVLVSPDTMRRWVNEFQPLREFVFSMLASQLSAVIGVVEDVAFQRVETRTAEYLLQAVTVNGAILKTHQDIATDVGTAREVVSRILKDFEHRGFIKLSRGMIQPQKPHELARLVRQMGRPSSADLN